jgi:hypothetical protein
VSRHYDAYCATCGGKPVWRPVHKYGCPLNPLGEQLGAEAAAALEALPRLYWCPHWQTLNEQRHLDEDGEPCGTVAYIRVADLEAARLAEQEPT